MSTANQECSGHTFFREREQDGNMLFLPSVARPIRGLLAYMCSCKMIFAADNEFPFFHFLLTTTQSHQGGGGVAESSTVSTNRTCIVFFLRKCMQTPRRRAAITFPRALSKFLPCAWLIRRFYRLSSIS